MSTDDDCTVPLTARELTIPARELWFEFDHARGPGGQHVNKTATRATVCFHPASSGALTPSDKARVARILVGRTGADGVLRVSVESERSQFGNRREAVTKLGVLLAAALTPPKPRRPTRPTRASGERRLDAKRRTAQRKADRRADENP